MEGRLSGKLAAARRIDNTRKKAFHDWLKSQKASYIGIGFLQIYFVVSLFSKIEGLLCQYQVQNGIICRCRDVIFLS